MRVDPRLTDLRAATARLLSTAIRHEALADRAHARACQALDPAFLVLEERWSSWRLVRDYLSRARDHLQNGSAPPRRGEWAAALRLAMDLLTGPAPRGASRAWSAARVRCRALVLESP